jgi:DNA-directed RNA polymerase specialized sigma24 family protein
MPPLSVETILQHLIEAYDCHALDSSLTFEMLPALAESLLPHLTRYQAKYGSFPEPTTFYTIVRNFNRDGPRVQALAAIDRPEGVRAWEQLRVELLKKSRFTWSELDSDQQEVLADQAWIRVQRYLSTYLFQAQLSTWIFKILTNEHLRLVQQLKAKQPEKITVISLDEELPEGSGRDKRLTADQPILAEGIERQEVIAQLRQRLAQLAQASDIKILALHVNGYTLEEIKTELGENGPALSTIKRRKDRLLARLAADPLTRQIAQELGILAAAPDAKK